MNLEALASSKSTIFFYRMLALSINCPELWTYGKEHMKPCVKRQNVCIERQGSNVSQRRTQGCLSVPSESLDFQNFLVLFIQVYW